VSALLAELRCLNEEIGFAGERIGSHRLPRRVLSTDAEGNDYSLKSAEPTMLPGCR
jgi:hypothetical protein